MFYAKCESIGRFLSVFPPPPEPLLSEKNLEKLMLGFRKVKVIHWLIKVRKPQGSRLQLTKMKLVILRPEICNF